jgi:protein-tyrosine phosphatase
LIDLSWVAPGLAVGAKLPRGDAGCSFLRALGVRRVVDLRAEARDDEARLGEHGIELLHVPTEAGASPTVEQLESIVDFIRAGRARGEKVYVHCHHGTGRSAVVALCVLAREGFPDAVARLADARPHAAPSPEQLEAFHAFCRRAA